MHYDVLGKLVENGTYTPYELQNYVFGKQLASGFYNAVVSQAGTKEVIKVIKK